MEQDLLLTSAGGYTAHPRATERRLVGVGEGAWTWESALMRVKGGVSGIFPRSPVIG